MSGSRPTKLVVLTEEGDEVPFSVEQEGDELIVTLDLSDVRDEAYTNGYDNGVFEGRNFEQYDD